METSSWVGANWSLNAGGVITRTVQGAPDEKATSNNAYRMGDILQIMATIVITCSMIHQEPME